MKEDECPTCGCIASDHNGVIFKITNGWLYTDDSGERHGPFKSAVRAATVMEHQQKGLDHG